MLTETNLPVDLIEWVVKDGVIKPSVLKTYLYIKLSCSDRFKDTGIFYRDIAKNLKINLKTTKKHIHQLLQVKFIGLDQKTNTFYIRSKYKIIPKIKRHSKYQIKVSFKHLKHFTEFLIAATVAYMVRKKRYTDRYGPALKNDGAFRSQYQTVTKFYKGYPISLTFIGKFLGKSTSWVDKYKTKAKKLTWIKSIPFLEQTGILWAERFKYLRYKKIPLGRAKKHKGKLHLVGIDILYSPIMVCKRKKGV